MVILSAQSDASNARVLWAVLALVTFSAYWVLARIARSSANVDPIEWMFSVNIWALMRDLPILIWINFRFQRVWGKLVGFC